jgi:hypothetical protein
MYERELLFLFVFTTVTAEQLRHFRYTFWLFIFLFFFIFERNKRIRLINILAFISAYKISKTLRRNVAEWKRESISWNNEWSC